MASRSSSTDSHTLCRKGNVCSPQFSGGNWTRSLLRTKLWLPGPERSTTHQRQGKSRGYPISMQHPRKGNPRRPEAVIGVSFLSGPSPQRHVNFAQTIRTARPRSMADCRRSQVDRCLSSSSEMNDMPLYQVWIRTGMNTHKIHKHTPPMAPEIAARRLRHLFHPTEVPTKLPSQANPMGTDRSIHELESNRAHTTDAKKAMARRARNANPPQCRLQRSLKLNIDIWGVDLRSILPPFRRP